MLLWCYLRASVSGVLMDVLINLGPKRKWKRELIVKDCVSPIIGSLWARPGLVLRHTWRKKIGEVRYRTTHGFVSSQLSLFLSFSHETLSTAIEVDGDPPLIWRTDRLFRDLETDLLSDRKLLRRLESERYVFLYPKQECVRGLCRCLVVVVVCCYCMIEGDYSHC